VENHTKFVREVIWVLFANHFAWQVIKLQPLLVS
jgi:hypothetical protein